MKYLIIVPMLLTLTSFCKAEEKKDQKVILISHGDKLPPPGVRYQYIEETTPDTKREATAQDAKVEAEQYSKESDSVGIRKGSIPPVGKRYFFIEDVCVT